MRVRTEEIYEALFDDEALARLPSLLVRVAGARSALMLWQHNDGFTKVVAHTGLPWFDDYAAFVHLDPYYAEAVRPQNENRVILPNEWISSARFERSEIYNELIRKHGDDTVYCTGAGVRSAWGSGAVGLHRGRSEKAFDSTDARRLSSVLVHVERVLRARGEILAAQRAAAMADATSRTIALAIIVVRSDRRIVQANEIAEAVMRRGDGLTAREGRIAAVTHGADKKLAGAIASATSSPCAATAINIDRHYENAPYLLSITPMVGPVGAGGALIAFRDPSREDVAVSRRLRALFGLSNAEAEIAAELAAGKTPSEIMDDRQVSKNTINAQVKSIMTKMRCHRQSQVAALIASLPPIADAGWN